MDYFIINLLATFLLYAALPLLISAFRKKPITLKAYRRWPIIISVIIVILLSFYYFLIGLDRYAFNFAPAALWTWIGVSIGERSLRKRGLIVDQDEFTVSKARKITIAVIAVAIIAIGIITVSAVLTVNESAAYPVATSKPYTQPTPTAKPTINTVSFFEAYQSKSADRNSLLTQQTGIADARAIRPENGTIFKRSIYEGLAPLEVNAPTDSDCYVYLHDLKASGTTHDIGFYVREDMSCEILVPLGTYEMYFATGDTWVSANADNNMVFGDDTVWNVSEDIFYFTDEEYYYSGYTVTLYSVYNGNMDTDVIAADDLPF